MARKPAEKKPPIRMPVVESPPMPPFWFKLSIRIGNMLQLDGLIVGCALLISAGHTQIGAVIRVLMMVSGWLIIYINSHAIAHWAAGRLGRIYFDGYGVRGTDHPENYPAWLRRLVSVLPTYTAISEKTSMKKATPGARALMFAAGETSTTVCSILAGLYAWRSETPGGLVFFIVMIVFNLASTFITARIPRGDYAKARQALLRPAHARR